MKRPLFFRIPAILSIASLCLFGAGCTKGPDAATAAASKRMDLTIWGVVDDEDVYDAIIKDYRALHPNVSISYRRLRLEEYEDTLLNALAEDRGPDIFMVHNTWIGKYLPKIAPMPASTKVAIQQVQGTIKKETVYVLQDQPTVTLRKYKNDYPDAVAKDTIRTVTVTTKPGSTQSEQKIVAVPLSVDTLGMFVNKDLLNVAGIPTLPETWDVFQNDVPKLVKQDDKGTILQAAAALGTGNNVERSPDIIALLMMQNGAEMSTSNGVPSFSSIPPALSDTRDEPPAFQALSFYTDFANPGKSVYTWNSKQPNSLDTFVQGKSAFFFGYSYHLPTIRARAPKLNLGIAGIPQIQGNPVINFANYWNWTVSKKTKNVDVAWNFLNFMIQPEEAKKYLTAAKRPAANKTLLTDQLNDENVGVFASQVLTAKSWYEGKDPRAMEDTLKVMIENVVNGLEEIPTAVRNAQSKVQQTF